MKKMLVLVLVVSSFLMLASVCQATANVVMDATHHNGSFTDGPTDYTYGHWSYTSLAIPTGWVETAPYMYTTATRWIQTGSTGEAVNNTGVLVQAGRAYTINADLGGEIGAKAVVRVYATQNSDGTGSKALLAEVIRQGTSASGDYTLFTVSSTGMGVSTSLAGYYVQVKIGDLSGSYPLGFYDNIVVTSDVATSMMYMNASLHNGGFAATKAGYWSDPCSLPTGWTLVGGSPYTTATRVIVAGSTGEGVNNTGELVLANHAYTVSADLGGGTGYDARVRVYATKNADGTGDKVLLASVNRIGLATDVYAAVYNTVGMPGSGTPSSLAGYYVQVRISGPYSDFNHYLGGNYDNIVVTSEVATSMTYMNGTLHNGSLAAETAGYWWNTPTAVPAGWVETIPYNYTTALRWDQIGTGGQAVNNTGEIVLASHKFTVQADLGGYTGILPTVKIYATEDANGSGTKLLLTQVSRAGNNADGTTLFTVSGPVSSVTPPSVAGYYVQVVLDGGGYYDNIIVTSELSLDPPTITYMDATLHNGAMDSEEHNGSWADSWYIPYEWSSTNPDLNDIWTTATGFISFDGQVDAVINNTGEIVPANHRFSIQADLGGFPGALAQAFVYATENSDGTGDTVLLAEVIRAGDANGLTPLFKRYTVSGTGSATDASVDGYYVQVMLKTNAAEPNLGGHYDNLVVTSKDATPIPLKTYMDPNLHNGALVATSSGYWTTSSCIPFGGWSAADPTYAYTFSAMFIALESRAGESINNTQETVIGNHRFKVQADLGGATGATAEVLVYATENWDGTGNKVLLTQVSRIGNDNDGTNLLTVSNTGLPVLPTLDGYYVQVVLKTTGNNDLNGYYDNIIVTSSEPTCGDAEHQYPIGDLDFDCYVEWKDLEIFAGQWLAGGCVAPGWCEGADLSYDATVNLKDFAILAENWLDCTDPELPCSYNP